MDDEYIRRGIQMSDNKMGNEELTQAQQYIQKYEADILKLMRYVPYFMDIDAKKVASEYDGSLGKSSLSFPVYDGTLMSFIKEAQKTVFMDKNYCYAYTKRRIRTKEQEEAAIQNATGRDADYLCGVISKYVTEGMRKSGVWQEAVERKLFLNSILKLKEILDYYKRF